MKTSLKNKAKLNDEQLKEAYRKMWLVRYFEEKVDSFLPKGKSMGQLIYVWVKKRVQWGRVLF